MRGLPLMMMVIPIAITDAPRGRNICATGMFMIFPVKHLVKTIIGTVIKGQPIEIGALITDN
jgi:hypothetical protein